MHWEGWLAVSRGPIQMGLEHVVGLNFEFAVKFKMAKLVKMENEKKW